MLDASVPEDSLKPLRDRLSGFLRQLRAQSERGSMAPIPLAGDPGI